MKTRILLTIALIIGIVGMGTLTFAGEKHTTGIAKASAVTKSQVNPIEVKGLVKNTDNGLSLFDGKKTYLLKGEKVTDELVGSLVLVSGDLQTTETGPTIIVESAVEVN